MMKPSQNEMKKSSITFNKLFNDGKYLESRRLLERMLKKYPNEHWLLINSALVNLELKKLKDALNFAKAAYKIEPNDPIVIEGYARVLIQNNNFKRATDLLEQIISSGLHKLISNPYSESKKWAKSLFIDSHYTLAMGYIKLGLFKEAKEKINEHLRMRKRGLFSIYYKKDIIKKSKEIEKLVL